MPALTGEFLSMSLSLPLRHRAGLVLAGFVFGAPLLGASMASAATTTVTFSGTPLLGLNTLACPSSPSQGNLTVAPGTVVDFVNRTGRTATLWAGDSQKTLPDKSFVPVTFTQGPASVVIQMLPTCSLDLGQHAKMTVSVTSAAAAPEPTQPGTTTAPAAGPGVTGAPPNGGSPVGPKPISPTRSSSVLAPTAVASTAPTDISTTAAGTTDGSAIAGNNDPFASPPAIDPTSPVLGDPVPAPQPRSASGLLTLIATVGVVGVSAAAIRAIIAQRATRAIVA
jgi:hypothetical protein